MKILYSLFVFLFCVGQLSAQNKYVKQLVNKGHQVYESDPAESFSLCKQAQEEAQLSNDHIYDGSISLCLGRYYLLVTNYELSTIELNKAELFFKQKDDKSNLAETFALKSILLSRLGEDQKAINLLIKVIDIEKELKDTLAFIGSLNNLSISYKDLNNLDSMKIVLDEIESYKNYFTPDYQYYYNQNLGDYYTQIGKYNKALVHLKIALNLAIDLDMTDSRATVLVLISTAHRLNEDLILAEQFCRESYDFSISNDLIFETSDALKELILIKKTQGNYKSAYELQQEWMRLEKEIFNLEKIQKIKAIEGQLKIAEKEKLIKEGQIALQAEKLEGEKTKSKNMWLFGVIIIVLILMIFTIYIYVKTKKLNTTIQSQKKEVELKSSSLEVALKNINDSIAYSKRIQNAILPPLRIVKSYLKDSFILYKPKDIVAGDFYWMEQKDGKILFAAADCTGHGVPGAMMSVVCNNALNRSVREHGLTNPGDILNKTREIVVEEFEKSDEEVKDGMDIALCSIKNMTLEYAGAHNPLWIIRNKTLIEIKGDKQPVGQFFKHKPFTSHTMDLKKGDVIYIFSDGYADQFGGENGKKFKIKALKNLLLSIQNKSMDEQKTFIDNHFKAWKGDLEQLDDVCFIGVKI